MLRRQTQVVGSCTHQSNARQSSRHLVPGLRFSLNADNKCCSPPPNRIRPLLISYCRQSSPKITSPAVLKTLRLTVALMVHRYRSKTRTLQRTSDGIQKEESCTTLIALTWSRVTGNRPVNLETNSDTRLKVTTSLRLMVNTATKACSAKPTRWNSLRNCCPFRTKQSLSSFWVSSSREQARLSNHRSARS